MLENFKASLRNATNSCLIISMENKNPRIAEFLIDKIIELNINNYESKIVEYETLSKLFEMEWWTEIEKIFDSFSLPRVPSSSNNKAFEIIVQNDENLTKSSASDFSLNESSRKKSHEVVHDISDLDSNSLELSLLLANNDSDDDKKEALPDEKTAQNNTDEDNDVSTTRFNFICIENIRDSDEIYDGTKEHFLMKIAKSGQSRLIQHKLVLRLVEKKWRYIPRLVYHAQTLMHFAFLVCFLVYILSENENTAQFRDEVDSNRTILFTNLTDVEVDNKSRSNYVVLVVTFLLLVYFLFYELMEAIAEKFAYLFSIKNWLECFTYLFAMIVLVTIQFDTFSQATSLLGSVSVLFGFIVLMLRLEKNSHFGAYVVAFRRSFANTMKTIPFILLLFIGFIFSFKIRSNNGVNFIANSTHGYLDYMSVAKMTNMIIGGYELSEMGLESVGEPWF